MSFDGEACIRFVRNNSISMEIRIAAAESLMFYPKPQAIEALYSIVTNSCESDELREEAAGSLGTLWAETGLDIARLVTIPDQFLPELVADWNRLGVKVDFESLGSHSKRFKELLAI